MSAPRHRGSPESEGLDRIRTPQDGDHVINEALDRLRAVGVGDGPHGLDASRQVSDDSETVVRESGVIEHEGPATILDNNVFEGASDVFVTIENDPAVLEGLGFKLGHNDFLSADADDRRVAEAGGERHAAPGGGSA